MAVARSSLATLRNVAAVVCIVAMAFRGAIAPGYMPDTSAAAAGIFKLVICTATGVKTVFLNDRQGSPDTSDHPSAVEVCPFATLNEHAISGPLLASFHVSVLPEPILNRLSPAPVGPAIRLPDARAPPPAA